MFPRIGQFEQQIDLNELKNFTWQVKLATLGNSMKETLDKTKTNLKHKLEVEDVRSHSKWAAS